jgi:hypothetical protein
MMRYGKPADEFGWRRASLCQNGECVEVRTHEDAVLMRSSRHPAGVIELSLEEWRSLLIAIQAGEFDDLAA